MDITGGYDVTSPHQPGEGGGFGGGWVIQFNPASGRYEPVYVGDRTNGGTGGSGGNVPTGGSDTPPTTTTTPGGGYNWNPPPGSSDVWGPDAGAAGGGLGSFMPKNMQDVLRLITTAYGLYGASRGSHFHQAPDPLTDMLRARMYGFIDNSPTRNMLGTALQNYVSQGNQQQMPSLPDKYHYNPYPNGVPKYDLSSMIPWIQQSMSPNQNAQAPQAPKPPDYTTPNMFPTQQA